MSKETQSRLDGVLDAVDRQETDPDRNIREQVERGIAKAIQAAKTSGETAQVKLTIKVVPDQGARVTFFAKCEERLPKPPTSGATLYTDTEGNLLESDPKQAALDLTSPKRTRTQTEN